MYRGPFNGNSITQLKKRCNNLCGKGKQPTFVTTNENNMPG